MTALQFNILFCLQGKFILLTENSKSPEENKEGADALNPICQSSPVKGCIFG